MSLCQVLLFRLHPQQNNTAVETKNRLIGQPWTGGSYVDPCVCSELLPPTALYSNTSISASSFIDLLIILVQYLCITDPYFWYAYEYPPIIRIFDECITTVPLPF